MSECLNPEFREQLPELAGDLLDRPGSDLVMQHVAACGPCAAELRVLQAVRAASIPIPFMNVSKIVSALPPAPVPVREDVPWYRRASVQLAAALVLVAGGLVAVRDAGDRIAASSAEVALSARRETDSGITVQGVDTSLRQGTAAPQLSPAAPAKNGLVLVAGLDEMTTDELTVLLGDVDKLAAVPVGEPEQFSPVTALSDTPGES